MPNNKRTYLPARQERSKNNTQMINKFVYKKLQELSPEQLYKPPTNLLTVHYSSPTEEEKKQFLDKLKTDKDFLVMDVEHQQGFQNFLFELERRLPILNTQGRFVKGNIRLIVCFEMTKLLYFRRKGIPKSLQSVIIEPENVFLTRYADATGLAHTSEPKIGLPHLEEIEKSFNQVFLKYLKINMENIEEQRLLKQQFKQIKRLVNREPLSDFYKQKLRKEITAVKGTLTYFFEHFAAYTKVDSVAETEQLQEQIILYKEKLFKTLNLLSGSVSTTNNGLHLYISWPYYLANIYEQKRRNVILHETAHAIDFENDGFSGIPTPAVLHQVDEQEWKKQWNEQFDKAINGKMNFLDKYALKNKMEFFAVSTELFFYQSDSIAKKAPELFALLEKTYSYIPKSKTSAAWKAIFSIPKMLKQFDADAKAVYNE